MHEKKWVRSMKRQFIEVVPQITYRYRKRYSKSLVIRKVPILRA